MRILLLSTLLVALTACKPSANKEQAIKIYPVRGVIVKVDIPGKSAAIDAEKIEGWMEAMTMDYPVHDPKILEGLKPGDHIAATVHVPEDLNYWIDNVSKATDKASDNKGK